MTPPRSHSSGHGDWGLLVERMLAREASRRALLEQGGRARCSIGSCYETDPWR